MFGVRNHAEVRKALRFFSERRIKTHFVDFKVRGPSIGELQRFAGKFGVDRLIDRESRIFLDLGLGPARYGDAKWLQVLADEPTLLVLPLVRSGNRLSIGPAPAEWARWLTEGT
ncbi:MAG TPA: ArsC/Spx/MgsR family protein [Gemmatimonadaceae bacterium]|nr:ArsC/Spx/MgsR family protein [Gemmatimonadaceae bacterium]